MGGREGGPPSPGPPWCRPLDSTRACQKLNHGMFVKSLAALPTAALRPLVFANEMLVTFHGSILSDKYEKMV